MNKSSLERAATPAIFALATAGVLVACQSTMLTVSCDPACAAGTHCAGSVCVADQSAADLAMAMPPDLTVPTCTPKCGGLTPICNDMHACVACITDDQCPIGNVCRKNGSTTSCIPGCTTDDRCRPQGMGVDGGAGMQCCGMTCIDTSSDGSNCGGCGNACVANHGGASCSGGVCTLGKCDSGWGDCNKDPKDGCESNLHVDGQNCGGCGVVCNTPNALSGCSDGCYLRACNFGFDDCNGDPKDGCETSVLSDVKNCGACSKPCPPLPHAKTFCASASCGLGACDLGWLDCDKMAANGCEAQVLTDANNCGACGNACPKGLVCQNSGCTCPQCNIPNAKSACVNNACIFVSCLQGFGDCNKNVADGCEVDLGSDKSNCGACGMACPNGLVCTGGACVQVICQRIGWQMGNANWTCPNGLRLPTVNELAKVQSCITNGDQGMFGYYNDIASSVGGCNCKWNGNWCGQPSVETIRGGRMCGDFAQLMICVN